MSKEMKNKISDLLKQKNMTQKELSLQTGISEAAICHYIKGDRVPRGVNLVKIARALNVPATVILDNEYNFEEIRLLIARNAQNMTIIQKFELIKILVEKEG